MKNQTINFRVDETTKLHLKEIAEELNFSESEFIRKAILSFRELTNQAQGAVLDKEKIQELEGQIKRFSYVLDTYEKNEAFNSLFQKYRGHTLEGIKINYKSDLIELLAKRATVEVMEDNADEATFSLSPVTLRAQLTPETVEEPVTWQDIFNGLKRNWVWLAGLGIALIVFLYWRWTATMKMRPKIVQFTPSKTEETKLAA
ncbi:hypothetical protein [Runella aurantiaca]|uniref:Ribbon-helix-helix protein, CopG family n=1 Tax=Runella aurantiaca TaxID=2282308 RepID=A0A369I742_9BACT|nr:hypothetical protein [Runella aurantiaca]RDB05621.1 hypothetical protein DVG78_13680 [Runella aurantiaca]